MQMLQENFYIQNAEIDYERESKFAHVELILNNFQRKSWKNIPRNILNNINSTHLVLLKVNNGQFCPRTWIRNEGRRLFGSTERAPIFSGVSIPAVNWYFWMWIDALGLGGSY